MLVTTQNFKEALDEINAATELVIDTETTGLYPYNGDYIVGIAVLPRSDTISNSNSFYFPFRHANPDTRHYYDSNLPETLLPVLLRTFENPVVPHIYHNATFDIHMLMKEGMKEPTTIVDTMTAAHILQENEPSFKLKVLADKYLDPKSSEPEQVLNALLRSRGFSTKAGMQWLRPEEVTEYAEMDAILTHKLWDFCKQYLEEDNLLELNARENDYNLVLNRAERRGIFMDRALCEQYSREAQTTAMTHGFNVQEAIESSTGRSVNPGSNIQMQKVLGLSSVAKDILELLIEDEDTDPITRYVTQQLLLYRVWLKADNTYYDPYLRHMDEKDVIHPHMNNPGTVSSRISSSDPNFTAVPQKAKAYKVKDVFKARPGYALLELDQSQAELRVTCHYAREKRMTDIINAGGDVHEDTGKALGITRRRGKTMNFSVVYGIGATGLSLRLDISKEEAKEFLDQYSETYPGIRKLYKKMSDLVKQQWYITLYTGRKRRYFIWADGKVEVIRKKNTDGTIGSPIGPHKAMNSLIQGTVAEIVRTSMIRIDHELLKWDIHQLLQVHDSILLEVPIKNWRWSFRQVQKLMEDFPGFNPRFKVDGKMGFTWGNMQHICTTCIEAFESEDILKGHSKTCIEQIEPINQQEFEIAA